jgi:hypothetical protein
MTTTLSQHVAEELEAALLEGAAPASPEAYELIERYRELNKLIAPFKAEQEAIKDLIRAELEKQHVRKLTHNGVVAVELILTHTSTIDKEALKMDEPEIAERYMVTKDGSRIDFKK